MSPRRSSAALALATWSLLIWTTRIRNIWTDDELAAGEQWARTALALSFTILGLGVGWAVLRRASWRRAAVVGLATWTIAVWLVRGGGIALADHDGAFIAVHLVLAAVSIVLAGLSLRQERAAADLSSG